MQSKLASEIGYLEQRVRFRDPIDCVKTECDLPALLRPRWPRLPKVYEFHIWGRCPACEHETEGLFSLYTQTGLSVATATTGINSEGEVSEHEIAETEEHIRQALGVQQCACVHNHPSTASPPAAPDPSTFGCGASWLVGIRYDIAKPGTEKFFVPTGPLEAEFWQSSKATADGAPKALSKIRKAAKGWSTALAAIIALVSLSGIIGGRDTLSTLGPNIQWTVVSLSGLSLVAAAAALYLSALANLGLPSLKRVSSPTRIRNNDLGPLHQAAHAARSLRIATLLTAVAFLAALAALGIFVEAPGTPPATTSSHTTTTGS